MDFLLLFRQDSVAQKHPSEEPEEPSAAQVIKEGRTPAVSLATIDLSLLLEHQEEDCEQPLAIRPQADEIRESVAINRCASTTDWVVDSGATSHCTGMDHDWIRYRALAPGEHEVIFADESKVRSVISGCYCHVELALRPASYSAMCCMFLLVARITL
jgi:hypothetical protein